MVTAWQMLSGRKVIPRAWEGDNAPHPKGGRKMTLHSLLILGISLTRDKPSISQSEVIPLS